MFSKACEYGIKATIFIASQSLLEVRTSLKDIVKEIGSPEAFTAKILQQLAKSKILESSKGPIGGFKISKDRIDEIRLSDIVYAIDGDKIYTNCGLGLKQCNAKKPCPVHDKFSLVREDLKKMLTDTSLFELANGLEIGITYLNR